MNKLWSVLLLTAFLAGCMWYPSDDEYYKPVVQQERQHLVNPSIKTVIEDKYQGLQQNIHGYSISVYPTTNEDNAISLFVLLESKDKSDVIDHAEIVTEAGALMAGPNYLTMSTKSVGEDGVTRILYEAKYPPLRTSPQHLMVFLTDHNGGRIEFAFEQTS